VILFANILYIPCPCIKDTRCTIWTRIRILVGMYMFQATTGVHFLDLFYELRHEQHRLSFLDNGKIVPPFTSAREAKGTLRSHTKPRQGRVHIRNRPINSKLLQLVESSKVMINQFYCGISIRNLQRCAWPSSPMLYIHSSSLLSPRFSNSS
jgi:hypothetical protein